MECLPCSLSVHDTTHERGLKCSLNAVGLSEGRLSLGFCQRKRGRVCGAVRGAESAELSESLETTLRRSRLSVCV